MVLVVETILVENGETRSPVKQEGDRQLDDVMVSIDSGFFTELQVNTLAVQQKNRRPYGLEM